MSFFENGNSSKIDRLVSDRIFWERKKNYAIF